MYACVCMCDSFSYIVEASCPAASYFPRKMFFLSWVCMVLPLSSLEVCIRYAIYYSWAYAWLRFWLPIPLWFCVLAFGMLVLTKFPFVKKLRFFWFGTVVYYYWGFLLLFEAHCDGALEVAGVVICDLLSWIRCFSIVWKRPLLGNCSAPPPAMKGD